MTAHPAPNSSGTKDRGTRRAAAALPIALVLAAVGGCRANSGTMPPPATPDGALGLDLNALVATAGFDAGLSLAQAAARGWPTAPGPGP